MPINIIYGFIVLIATTIGAIAGLGGGVIIKPTFDMLGFHSPSTISLYSSCAVFTMALVSIFKLYKKGIKFKKSILLPISLGSIFGGNMGERIFKYAVSFFHSSESIKIIQSFFLLITLIFILIYTLNKNKIKTFKLENPLFIFMIGFLLGYISIFLGIGGGPLNIALLTICFSYDMKEAAVYSVATIFFSQCSKLIGVFLKNEFINFDLSPLPIICIFAVLGGYIGAHMNIKFSSQKIERVYITTMLGLVLICISNMYFA